MAKPLTPEEILEEKQMGNQLYTAMIALPEKQAKRIYARFYLNMSVKEIAHAEGVDSSRVYDSIRCGCLLFNRYGGYMIMTAVSEKDAVICIHDDYCVDGEAAEISQI